MNWSVFAAATASALLHAMWNMLGKTRTAPRELFVGIVFATASICAPLAPLIGPPPEQSWPWLVAASVTNVIYLRVLIIAYKVSSFSLVYVVVRTVIPPTMFIFGWALLTETGRSSALVGLILATISLFLFGVRSAAHGRLDRRGVGFSLIAGLLLSVSLLFDVNGIRAGGAGALSLVRYSVASSILTASGLISFSVLRRSNPLTILVDNAQRCYLGAALLLASYLLGMWAYTQGPIGLVAPLRESGIIFSGLLAVSVLRERISQLQWVAIGLATTGIVLIQIR